MTTSFYCLFMISSDLESLYHLIFHSVSSDFLFNKTHTNKEEKAADRRCYMSLKEVRIGASDSVRRDIRRPTDLAGRI